MKEWLVLLALPPVVALLPWSVALVRGRRRAAVALFGARFSHPLNKNP